MYHHQPDHNYFEAHQTANRTNLSKMDILLSEISNKRKDLTEPAGSSRPQKYMRKADIERAKEEEARKKREEAEQKKREEALAKDKEKVRA